MPNPVFTDIFDGNLADNNTTSGTALSDVILGDDGNDILALLNPSMNHAIASSLRAHSARSATEPYFR
jgi:hypothetical protein